MQPDYIINELNINSAIAFPGHKEVVSLVQGGKATKSYPVRVATATSSPCSFSHSSTLIAVAVRCQD